MKQKNIQEQVYESFLNLFNQIGKEISFNREWHTGIGDIAGVVESKERRLIMKQGEYAKTTDNYGRKIILIGSHFGTIAIYPNTILRTSGVPELVYYATKKFAEAVSHFLNRLHLQRGLMREAQVLRLLEPHDFQTFMDTVKQHCIENRLHVGDGLPRLVPGPSRQAKGVGPKTGVVKKGGPRPATVRKDEKKIETEPKKKHKPAGKQGVPKADDKERSAQRKFHKQQQQSKPEQKTSQPPAQEAPVVETVGVEQTPMAA